MTFATVKQNFDRKLWDKKVVAKAVKKGVITPAEYKTITGETYKAS